MKYGPAIIMTLWFNLRELFCISCRNWLLFGGKSGAYLILAAFRPVSSSIQQSFFFLLFQFFFLFLLSLLHFPGCHHRHHLTPFPAIPLILFYLLIQKKKCISIFSSSSFEREDMFLVIFQLFVVQVRFYKIRDYKPIEIL